MTRRVGFSLVELVMVLAVTVFVVSLFAPLVLQARSDARRAECSNNLRQIGLAWSEHEQALNFMPSSGWGWRWAGDPDRGFGQDQPGGWAYDVLRFTQYSDIVLMGAGKADEEKAEAMLRGVGTPIPTFYCPDRRQVRAYPLVRNGDLANNLRECRVRECSVARTDYQANSGNVAAGETGGPAGDRSTDAHLVPYAGNATGVTFHVSETRLAHVEDGISKTMCVGEKYLNSNNYFDGNSPGDDHSLWGGIDRDLNGYTASASRGSMRAVSEYRPRRDRHGIGLNWTFGSAHKRGLNVAMVDTSVRFLSYDVDHVAFYRLGGRADGPMTPPADP